MAVKQTAKRAEGLRCLRILRVDRKLQRHRGAKTPLFKNKARVDAYREEYEALKSKYNTQVCPPGSDDID